MRLKAWGLRIWVSIDRAHRALRAVFKLGDGVGQGRLARAPKTRNIRQIPHDLPFEIRKNLYPAPPIE